MISGGLIMGRYAQDDHNGQADAQHILRFDAQSGDSLALPIHDLGNAQILRDGSDLLLQSAGKSVIVENYFTADTAPVMTGQNGMALTPELVRSFAQPVDGVQYAQKGSVDDASPVGIIREATGEATVIHTTGVVEKAGIGTPIYEGDIVETKAGGAINITFIDDTTFAVSENARMAIDEYVFDPATQGGESNFSVLRGVFVFTSGLIGREDPDDVQIETPVGSIGIRGTTIMGHINPDGESQITVVEGAIVVRNTTGETTLSQQFETVKISGMNAPMGDADVLNANQVANDYNVIRSVSAPLFSTFDDAGQTADQPPGEAPVDAAPQGADDAAPAPDAEQPAPAEPVNKTDAAPANAETTAEALAQLDDQNLISFDAGFDQNAGIENTLGLNNNALDNAADQPLTVASIFSAPAPLPGAPAVPHTSAAPISPTAPVIDPTLLPPPIVSAPGGTVITPPVTIPPVTTTGTIDLDLNTLISTATGGNYIAGATAGANYGTNLAALGDINHDGRMDYATVNDRSTGGSLFVNDNGGNNHTVNLGSMPYYLSDTTGLTVAGLGDFNRDGFGDIAIGAYLADDSGQLSSGKIIIASGANPSQAVMQVTGFTAGQFAGFSISGAGDFNGDGINDLIVGAPYNAGTGITYILFGTSSNSTININTLNPTQGIAIAGNAGKQFGADIAGIGDFNGDGYSDLVSSEPLSGTVKLFFGNNAGVQQSPLTITGIGTDPSDKSIPVVGMGDMNGDGRSDFALADNLTNTVHIFYGGSHISGTVNVSASSLKITVGAGSDLIGGGSAGDFNSDGHDDAVIATRLGDTVDIYVFYGDSNLSGTVNMATLTDDKVFHMTLDLSSSQFNLANPLTSEINLSLTSAGDLNNDGFDDLLVGAPELSDNTGGVLVIYGRAEGYDLATGAVQMGVSANQTGQTLIGGSSAETMSNMNGATSYDNIAFKAGGGNDTINLFGNSVRGIDGGAGYDTLNIMSGGNIDLRGLGDHLSSVEQFNIGATTAGTLTLRIDQIFQLLQQSSDGTLRFSTDATGATLRIDNNDNGKSTLADLGFTDQGTTGSTESWGFGGYTLYVDSDVAVTVASVA